MRNEFTLVETFKAKPEEIYRAWLSTDGHTAMTGSADDFAEWVVPMR